MKHLAVFLAVSYVLLVLPDSGFGSLLLNPGPEQLVKVGGADIKVNGYSVPSYVDWNNDGLSDLVVGEGGTGDTGTFPGKVRVYLNVGSSSNPQFASYSYATSNGAELSYSYGCNCYCLGLFPRVVDWDGDGRKDLIAGTPEGNVLLYMNIGTAGAPTFDGGTVLQYGPAGAKVTINVIGRATPTVVDWNGDNKKDLVIGSLNGMIYVYLNGGTDTEPDFASQVFARKADSDLVVPSYRSSPVIADLDGDGKIDLLTGNTDGQLLFYSNTGTNSSPVFSADPTLIQSGGVPIDLLGTPRSRPFVCDWNGDGYLDVLIGAADGNIHLYVGVPEPGTIMLLGLGSLLLRKRSLYRRTLLSSR